MHRLRRALVVSLAIFASAAPLGAAPGDPVGDDFQVNTYTTESQTDPVVAADGAGGFVVAWESGPTTGTDQSSSGIWARRFDATGVPRGDEFQVNTYTTGEQSFPTVIRDGTGFTVLWNSAGSDGTDHIGTSIQAQRYDANGPLGGQFQVNSYTTGYQTFPVATPLNPDGFVVVWRSTASGGTDTSEESVQAHLFDAAWTPTGSEFQVNSYTSLTQDYPAVAALDGGGFVVVWNSQGANGDNSARSVHGQRYNAAGGALGGQFQVNTYTTQDQAFPGVGSDGAGGFVVVWFSDGSAGTDTSGSSLQARRYDGVGTPQGPEFQVNTYTTGNQFGYSLGPDGAGALIIVWESNASPGDDTDGDSVQGRRFAANGDPLGDQFQVNTYTTDGQNFTGVAPDGAGGFVVVWRSERDPSGHHEIRARRFEGTPIPTTTSSTTTPTASTTSTTVRPGESVDGRTLQLTGKPGRPEKSKLALAAKDGDLTLGRGNQSDDDPVVNGGRLTIASATGGFDATHDLAGSWKYVGKAGQNRGYKWKSRTAPIRTVVVKPGKLAVGGQGASLGVDLDDDPNPVRIQLAIGAQTYCVEFGGDDRRFKANRLFRAKNAAAPATCP
jgi:hypothetical protein